LKKYLTSRAARRFLTICHGARVSPHNDNYCPDDLVTRGQFAAHMNRALGLMAGADADLFTDTAASIFETDINKIATAGITLGCNPPDNDNLCPDDLVTRGQMAAFLLAV
jgi:hypothetical protein